MSEVDELLGRLVQYVEKNFHDGDRLPSERDLAETFGVGRNQLRESLSKLEAYRLVAVRPKARAVVTRGSASLEQLALRAEAGSAIDIEEIRQAIEVRRIIEIAAIRLACERIERKNLDRMESILEESERKLGLAIPIAEEDEIFHMEVIRAAGNDVLVQTARPFYAMTRARRRLYFAKPQRCKASHAEHLELFAALQHHDVSRAAALLSGHLDGAASYWATLAGKHPIRRRTP